ncbi:MAG: hypothetical protein MI750_06475 [Xanthomonadales bacterium]|nr:hypothetical protein [Xanthomonadales bacterium]
MESSTAILWVQAGGLFHVALALFHLMFWKLFRWREQLERLHPINRGIFQVLNLRLSYVFVVFATLSFLFPEDLITSNLGRALLAAITLFWLMRAFEQLVFFTRHFFTWLYFLVFLSGAALYAWPLLGTFDYQIVIS